MRIARPGIVTGDPAGDVAADAVTRRTPAEPAAVGEHVEEPEILAGPRVGVSSAADEPWRFWIAGDPTVSTYRRHTPRRRAPA